jgi:hypothetical protein
LRLSRRARVHGLNEGFFLRVLHIRPASFSAVVKSEFPIKNVQ